MPTVLQFRRGTTAQNNSFTGSAGELSIDTDLEVIRVHDGSHPGGYALIGANAVQTMTNKTLSAPTITDGMTANGNLFLNNGTSNIHLPATNGNVHFTVASNSIMRITSAGIVNDMGNGVGNIGNSTGYFNTVFAKATSAQYADVAELYAADKKYDVGTVLIFGGEHEVTVSAISHDTAIAGTVSQHPAYVMNSGLQASHPVAVALLGRVPCKAMGPVAKGDLLVASDQPGIACRLDQTKYQPGCVIGKAVESHAGSDVAVIEVVVGRL
jgi:hypothetical protein